MSAILTGLLEGAPDLLSPIGAGILAAAHCKLSADSRSFARQLGLAHALVLRECVVLAEELQLIELHDREDRSQRLFYELTDRGQDLIRGCMPS